MNENDRQICREIKSGGTARNNALKTLYQSGLIRKSILKKVTNSGGNKADATDVFQEAIILFDKKVREGRFQHKSKISTYVIGLGKYIWYNRQREDTQLSYTDDNEILDEVTDHNPEIEYISTEMKEAINTVLKKTGELCYKILKLWKESVPMREIAEKLNMTSYNAARKKKYRCKKKLMKLIEEDAQLQSILNT